MGYAVVNLRILLSALFLLSYILFHYSAYYLRCIIQWSSNLLCRIFAVQCTDCKRTPGGQRGPWQQDESIFLLSECNQINLSKLNLHVQHSVYSCTAVCRG